MGTLDLIAHASVITALLSAPFFLFSCVRYLAGRNRGPASRVASMSFPVFMSSVVFGLFAGWTATSIGRAEVMEKLRAASENCHISINGELARNPREILRVLQTLHRSPAHHSHPATATTRNNGINIDASCGSDRMRLRLARDSDDPKEYWVFLPKYWITSTSEIGRINTSAFDSY
jgi:hypothetical protein